MLDGCIYAVACARYRVFHAPETGCSQWHEGPNTGRRLVCDGQDRGCISAAEVQAVLGKEGFKMYLASLLPSVPSAVADINASQQHGSSTTLCDIVSTCCKDAWCAEPQWVWTDNMTATCKFSETGNSKVTLGAWWIEVAGHLAGQGSTDMQLYPFGLISRNAMEFLWAADLSTATLATFYFGPSVPISVRHLGTESA